MNPRIASSKSVYPGRIPRQVPGMFRRWLHVYIVLGVYAVLGLILWGWLR